MSRWLRRMFGAPAARQLSPIERHALTQPLWPDFPGI